jgi:hypothetical protein
VQIPVFVAVYNKVEKKKGFESCILEEDDLVDSEDLKDLSVSDVVCYLYARLVSCDEGASTSRNPKGLHGLYRENFTFLNHSSVMATQIYDIQVKMASVIPCSSASLF